jgi:putative ABC transport system ATP-binding protein
MADIIFDNVSKDYKMGEVTIHAAKQVSFQVRNGELGIILGPSGAGKTTVLNLLGGMENARPEKFISMVRILLL